MPYRFRAAWKWAQQHRHTEAQRAVLFYDEYPALAELARRILAAYEQVAVMDEQPAPIIIEQEPTTTTDDPLVDGAPVYDQRAISQANDLAEQLLTAMEQDDQPHALRVLWQLCCVVAGSERAVHDWAIKRSEST